MSLWADYYQEREGAETIEEDYGFIVYKFMDQYTCLITNAYVDPNYRRLGKLRELVDMVIESARDRHCNRLATVVDLMLNGASRNIGIYINRGGMKISHIDGDKVFLWKGI